VRRGLEEILDVPDEERYGPTPLWDAVDAAVAELEPVPGRRMVILITDGLATGNRRSLQAVIDRARAADVSVSVIVEAWRLRSPAGWSVRDATRSRWTRMTRALGGPIDVHVQRLARDTGGIALTDGADGWPAPGLALADILNRLRARTVNREP
jgi:hypothetical protein